LQERSDAPVDWRSFADPIRHTGAAGTFIDRALAARR